MKKILSIFCLIAVFSLITPAYAHNMPHKKMHRGHSSYYKTVNYYNHHYTKPHHKHHISKGTGVGIAIAGLLIGGAIVASLDNNHYHYYNY